MVLDALRGYLQLANGLTDVTRQRALAAAKQLMDQGGGVVGGAVGGVPVAKQVQALAEDLVATSRNNRDLLVGLVRTEVDRAVSRFGLVSADELAGMARKVERLERQLDAAIAFAGTDAGDVAPAPAKQAAKKIPAKKAAKKVAKKAVKKVPAKKVPAKKVPAKKVPVATTSAPRTVARRVPAKRTSGAT